MDMKNEKTIVDKKAVINELIETGKKKGVLSYKEIRKELLLSIKDDINDKHKALFNLLRLNTKKKQV